MNTKKIATSRSEKLKLYEQKRLNTNNMWVLFLFFGWSYGNMNQMGKQIFYYLTLGGLGLWTIYVLVTLSNKMKRHNLNIATEIGLDDTDISMFNLRVRNLKALETAFAVLSSYIVLISFITIWVNILF